jgi:hypothetical protein
MSEPNGHSAILGHYRRLLEGARAGDSGLESAGGGDTDLSSKVIDERVKGTRAILHRIVQQHLGGGADLLALADQIVDKGGEALRMLGNDDAQLAQDPALMGDLEAIVRTDGSRPSFMVRDGKVDASTSVVGTWEDALAVSAEKLEQAIACVGRIDDPNVAWEFQGTGFLIQKNLLVTNRHVLQAIADENGGAWQLHPGISIDFGHEHDARQSVGRRALKRVVFAGSRRIDPMAIDHTKLDLALIELAGAPPADQPATTLPFDITPNWARPRLVRVYTIGYPGEPQAGAYKLNVLEKLFHTTFGYKRVAPGQIVQAQAAVAPWTLAHDATTLGGNSGSVVVAIGNETSAAGLHYGGRPGQPGENWGHIVGRLLDEQDPGTKKTLRQTLELFEVSLVQGEF